MKAQIVSFHCVLKNKLGQVLSSSFNQDVINQLESEGGRLKGLVDGLQNVTQGEKRQVAVSAGEAYGLYDPKLILEVPRAELALGHRLVLGNEVARQASANHGESRMFRVIRTSDLSVTLDGNHPLAGQDLIFDIEVVSARDAIEEDFEPPVLFQSDEYLH